MAAKLSKVSTLHDLLTELFIEDIQLCRTEGIPMSAADKAVIVKFLKDNNVTAEPDEERVQELRDEFKDDLEARREAKRKHILLKAAGAETDPLAGILN